MIQRVTLPLQPEELGSDAFSSGEKDGAGRPVWAVKLHEHFTVPSGNTIS